MKQKYVDTLFYIAYVSFFASLFLGDVYTVGTLDVISRYLRIISYILIVISCIGVRFTKKDFFIFCIIFSLGLIYAILTNDIYWCILTLLLFNSRKVNIKNIFRISIAILLIGIAVVIALVLLGFLPDILTARDSLSLNSYTRHSFGFYTSNVLPLLTLYILSYYILIFESQIKISVIIFTVLTSLVISELCDSRNAFILSVVLSAAVICIKISKCKYRILLPLSRFLVPSLIIISYAMLFLLPLGGIWNTIDTLFSGRFRLGIFKMRRIGLHPVNIMSNDSFFDDNVTYVNGEHLDTVVLDNGYLYVGLRYGILILLFYIYISQKITSKYSNRPYILLVTVCVFTANFVDNDLVDYCFLPFILLAFCDRKETSILDGGNNEKSSCNYLNI